MEEESPQERQDNEFEALKSIFGNDLEDNREAIVWKLWRPLDLFLTLNPLHSSTADGVHCSVTLHIKCCQEYPNKVPTINFKKKHGLSNDNAHKLLQELHTLAKELCGEVMIFELAQHVQNFLHAHNKPTLSFYDQMMARQHELEKMKLHDQKVKADEERQKIKEEIEKQRECLKNEGRQRSHRRSVSQEAGDFVEREYSPELLYYEDNKELQAKLEFKGSHVNVPCTCPSKTMVTLRISQLNNKKIHVGNCLGHSQNGSISNVAMDSDTGELLTSKKWLLNPTSDLSTRNRQLNNLENDFKSTYRINHTVLVPYRTMEFISESKQNRNLQYVYLFRDYIQGCSLNFIRKTINDEFDALKIVRHIAGGVFSALYELHSVGTCHSDVRDENVFLDVFGGVKLVGASLDIRLMEIVQGRSYSYRQTKSYDIYCTAQLLLSLISKNRTGQEIPSHLPNIVKDFFSKCLTEDSSFQWNAKQLLEHAFLLDVQVQVSDIKEKDDGYSGSEDESRKLAKKFVEHCIPASGHSRLSDEFEVIKILGNGAFGEVIKVRNKLDGGFYAIKHIKLNPENVQLNKKITREVKLLSRLNHENVVRYYNAWIETTRGPLNDDSSERTDTDVTRDKAQKSPQKSPQKHNRALTLNSIENVAAKLAPGFKCEWSISETPVQKGDSDTDSSESSDDDDDDAWINPATTDDVSTSIEFEVDINNRSITLPSEVTEVSRPPTANIHQALYIQMEFCEKSTLRQAIDNSLYLEHVRAWRLFREIVEGLAHVHQRGMIHRDLKPVNIFLDSNDHVKIGDFGLATTAFPGLPRQTDDKNKTQEEFGDTLTGQVGTAMYVAPELLQAANKVIYNQKVDIYSLGIILFEMFHPPLDTGMERIKVLRELRLSEIKLPATFNSEQHVKEITVLRWLLNHDPSKRPTCAELLSGPYIPRPMAESAVVSFISHTLNSKGTKSYQKLIDLCMGQRCSKTEDFMYNSNLMKMQESNLSSVKESIVKVFKRHGAVELIPPLLQSRAVPWEQCTNAVKTMTSFGSVVHLPHDLRLPFARFTAYSDIKYIRRYIIDRVYRERSTNSHPREILECAFDIVTPKTVYLWSDAELLVVASSVAAEIGLEVSFQINHTAILKIILLSCGITEDKHVDLYPVLVDVGTGRISKIQLQTHLTSLCLTPTDTADLLKLLESEIPLHEAKNLIHPMIKKHELNDQFNKAVTELEAVTRNANALGVENPITFMPCLAYNATQHGGIFWQLSCSRDRKKASQNRHRSSNIIAVGGRYNTLVEVFWQVAKSGKDEQDLKTSSVGFSMSLERIAAILKKREGDVAVRSQVETKKVCVCLWGTAGNGRKADNALRRASLLRKFLRAGVTACAAECRTAGEAYELTAAPIVVVLEDNAPMVTVTCSEDTYMRDYKMSFAEVLDFVKQKLNPDSPAVSEVSTWNRSVSLVESEKMISSTVNVVIIADGKIGSTLRKRYESQASNAMTSLMNRLGICRRACVLALGCSGQCVKAYAAYFDEDNQDFVRVLLDRYPQYSRVLTETTAELSKMTPSKGSEDATLFALYSLSDAVCKLLV